MSTTAKFKRLILGTLLAGTDNGDGTMTVNAAVPESAVSFTDITTGNASTTKHGYLKKLPNDAAVFLNGTGAFSSAATTLQVLFSWGGSLPAATGTGIEIPVPYNNGASATFTLSRAFARVATPGVAPTLLRLEKSVGGGAFSSTTITTLTVAAAGYEVTNTGLATTVTSGQIVRIEFISIGTSGAYTVTLQGAV